MESAMTLCPRLINSFAGPMLRSRMSMRSEIWPPVRFSRRPGLIQVNLIGLGMLE
jgi:hypothetical protein